MSSRARLSRRKRALFAIVALLLVVVVVEIVSYAAIAVLGLIAREKIQRTTEIFADQSRRIRNMLRDDPNRRTMLDPVLGWRNRTGYRSALEQINAQGLRGAREYTTVPPPGALRVAAFGDSLVFGVFVADRECWPAQVEEHFPGIEVLNYGIPGFGADQAYLRYLTEGKALAPAIVVLGFAPEDLGRIGVVYKRFLSTFEEPLTKPRYIIDAAGKLSLLPNPAPKPADFERFLRHPRAVLELGTHDYWYRPAVYQNPLYDYWASARFLTWIGWQVSKRYLDSDRLVVGGVFNRRSTIYQIQMAVFEQFARDVRAAGSIPMVAIFTDRDAVARDRRRQFTAFQPLVDDLRAKGIECVDLTAAFRAAGDAVAVADWFVDGIHYSPAGNKIVSLWLGRRFQELGHRAGVNTSGAAAADVGRP